MLSRAGIGRATRELAKSLAAIEDVGSTCSATACPRQGRVPPPRARLHRAPIPGRALPLLRRIGVGADTLAGRAPLFHWTDYVQPPVRGQDCAHGPRPRLRPGPELARRGRWSAARTNGASDRRRRRVDHPDRDHRRRRPRVRPGGALPRAIPWGADHVPAQALPRAHDGDYALCVGTIEPRKNHLALLEAWRRLPPSRPRLVVVGAVGWECQDAVAALTRAEQDGVAVWRRDVGDRELWSLLQHARLLAYPALWEGFGFPPLEAMALGVPVVAHDTPALREVGDEGPCFADATDTDALTDALATALFDEDVRARHVRASRKRAQDFTWRRCAEQHRDLYREVCA